MFQRSTLILLIVAAALGSAIYWFEIKQEQEHESADRMGRLLFPEMRPMAIDELAFETADEYEVRFERVDYAWHLREPVDFPAAHEALQSMASALASLSSDEEIQTPEALSVYGLGEQAGLIHFAVQGERQTLRLGALTPVPGHLFVSRNDEKRVFLLQNMQLNAFHRLLLDLRERHPVSLATEDVSDIAIDWRNASLALAKREGQWRIVFSSLASATEELPRAGAVSAFLTQLTELRADAFVDQVPPALSQTLEREGMRIRLSGEEISLELLVEPSQAQKIAVRGAETSLFLVPASSLEGLPRRVEDFLDLRVAPFDVSAAKHWELVWHDAAGEVASQVISHSQSNGAAQTWRLEGGAEEKTQNQTIRNWLEAASELSGEAIVADGLDGEGRMGLGLEPGKMRFRVWAENMHQDELLADLRVGNALLSHRSPDEDSDRAGRVLMMNALGESVYGVAAEISASFMQKAEWFRKQERKQE